MQRGLRKFHAGFPRSCCLTNSYSKRKFVTCINVYMSPYFWFWNKKSIVFILTKKTVRCIKFKFKLNQNGQSVQNNGPFAWWRHFTTMTRILESFAFFWKLALCYLNLTGATKVKYEKKTEKNSGRSSKMTPSCKWPIRSMKVFYGLEKGRKASGDGAGLTVQNVRLSIATSWPSEKAKKTFPLSQYSTTVTGCACYHGFSSSTTFGQSWRSCSHGCDRWVWPSALHRGILATTVEKQFVTN